MADWDLNLILFNKCKFAIIEAMEDRDLGAYTTVKLIDDNGTLELYSHSDRQIADIISIIHNVFECLHNVEHAPEKSQYGISIWAYTKNIEAANEQDRDKDNTG